MSIWRAVLCVFLPPLAVLDKGCGMAALVGFLWLLGGVPGIIAAFAINLIDQQPSKSKPIQVGNRRFVEVPAQGYAADPFDDDYEKQKRKGVFVRLADGEIAEVIEDDGAMPEQRKQKGD
jgi:uncharacterized membrane protein YqaE (UPF0057 family)